MKYLLMCCHEEKKREALSKRECEVLMEETSAYCEALRKSGHLIMAEPLESVQTAMTVRVRNGRTSVTDGPFVETKEELRILSHPCERSERGHSGGVKVSVRALRQPGGAACQGPAEAIGRRQLKSEAHPCALHARRPLRLLLRARHRQGLTALEVRKRHQKADPNKAYVSFTGDRP